MSRIMEYTLYYSNSAIGTVTVDITIDNSALVFQVKSSGGFNRNWGYIGGVAELVFEAAQGICEKRGYTLRGNANQTLKEIERELEESVQEAIKDTTPSQLDWDV